MAWIEQWKYSKAHKSKEEKPMGTLNIISHGYLYIKLLKMFWSKVFNISAINILKDANLFWKPLSVATVASFVYNYPKNQNPSHSTHPDNIVCQDPMKIRNHKIILLKIS